MSIEPWLDDAASSAQRPETAPHSQTRLIAERIAIGGVAVLSLLIPLVIGLLFYLAVNDEIVVNADDPLRTARLWMVMEKAGATGLGLSIAAPAQAAGSVQCAFTTVIFLKWDKPLRLETNASYCTCYERRNNQLIQTNNAVCR